MFVIMRRNERLPEAIAVTELTRAPHLAAARRVAYGAAFRFFEALGMLDCPAAARLAADALSWDGKAALDVTCGGQRFIASAQ